MHELSVTQNILEIVLRHSEQAGAHKVMNIYLVIGQLSSIIDESIQFYWDIISKDTAAHGATLHFQRIPAEILCLSCNSRYKLKQADYSCPLCGGLSLKILAGEEFYIDSIDIET